MYLPTNQDFFFFYLTVLFYKYLALLFSCKQISIISNNQSIQLLGLHRDNTALVTCPSEGLGIARADNVEKSRTQKKKKTILSHE
ncbi:hypothetical protein BgiMline_027787, partial [Biomphalaria glabrata]